MRALCLCPLNRPSRAMTMADSEVAVVAQREAAELVAVVEDSRGVAFQDAEGAIALRCVGRGRRGRLAIGSQGLIQLELLRGMDQQMRVGEPMRPPAAKAWRSKRRGSLAVAL